MLKTAHDAEEFMRTGARVSPSWPGGDLRRIRCSRLISRRYRQNPLQTGQAIRFNKSDVLCSLMGQGRDPPPGVDAFGYLRSLRARSALDGVSWVQRELDPFV